MFMCYTLFSKLFTHNIFFFYLTWILIYRELVKMLHEPRQFWSLLKNWTCILYRCSNTTYVWQEVFRKLLTFDLILFRRNFFVRIKEGFLLFLVKPICLKWEISPSLLWRVWHFSYWKFSIFFSHSLFGLFPQFDASYVLWRFSST